MSEFKGTKGKWVLRTFPEGQMSVRTLDDTRKICVPRVQNYEESLANLLLISKSFEMLEMLKYAVEALKAVQSWGATKPIIKRIEQLIKEATDI